MLYAKNIIHIDADTAESESETVSIKNIQFLTEADNLGKFILYLYTILHTFFLVRFAYFFFDTIMYFINI